MEKINKEVWMVFSLIWIVLFFISIENNYKFGSLIGLMMIIFSIIKFCKYKEDSP